MAAISDDLVPARMLNELVYCRRLFYLMHVEGLMEASADVWQGRYRHAGRDKPSDRASRRQVKTGEATAAAGDEDADDDQSRRQELPEPWREATALSLSSEALGLVGKLDTVLLSPDGVAVPAELKKGKAPSASQSGWCWRGLWRTDAVQLGAQGLLLSEAGYQVPRVEAYYSSSRKLVAETFDDELADLVTTALEEARQVQSGEQPPAPLVDSPKCARCSLNEVCLPEESALLATGAGYIDDPEAEAPRARRLVPARVDSSILVVEATAAKLRRRGESLLVDIPASIAEAEDLPRETLVPFDSVHEVCLVGNAQITAQALVELLGRGVPVSHLTRSGRYLGTTLGPWGNNVALRIAQHQLVADNERRLPIARAIVAGKIRNQRTLIRRNDRDAPARALEELSSLTEEATKASGIDELMGYEGRAARLYFDRYAEVVQARTDGELTMNGRSRRPPRDPVNALLSFGYALLAKDLVSIAHRAGFDPMVGFLHSPGFGRPALALDLMEEFRALVVDSTVLRLLAQGQIEPSGFIERPGQVLMRSTTRRTLIRGLERRKKELVTHPVFGYRLSYHRTMDLQARLLGRVVTGEAPDYLPFTTR